MKSVIRVGTRGSSLALYQAELVRAKILEDFPLISVEIIKVKTGGDMQRRGSNDPFDTKRMYTKEIEEALLQGSVDMAVHSAKDLSVLMPEGLKIGAVLEREDPRDCLISKDHLKISELPIGARVGTSSLRRKMQLLRWNPELIVEELHGNVDSRIRKINEGNYDAIILAHAGVKRLGFSNYVSEVFQEDLFYPAAGQGIIVVQSREKDAEAGEILAPLNHEGSAKQLACERAFLRRLEGGCQLPCGIATYREEAMLRAKGAIFSTEEHTWVESQVQGLAQHPDQVGDELARMILNQGGKEILEKMRHAQKKDSR